MNVATAAPLLEAHSLTKLYQGARRTLREREVIRAVDGVSFKVRRGETLSIVGESGCGKSTTARLLLRLEPPSSGHLYFNGLDITSTTRPGLREYRKSVQAVFQDPWSSLNPRMRAGHIVGEPLRVRLRLAGSDLRYRVAELFEDVGLDRSMVDRYPHEFSGGQRQRIAIARAISLNPSLVVLDEPVSSLDVSIRAQVMNLLRDIQDRHGVSYILIAHDLATVRFLSHRVTVMYLGKIVEEGSADQLFERPLHPYTQALISAADTSRDGVILSGEVPSPSSIPPGCRFHTRCPQVMERCKNIIPQYGAVEEGHLAACHLYPQSHE